MCVSIETMSIYKTHNLFLLYLEKVKQTRYYAANKCMQTAQRIFAPLGELKIWLKSISLRDTESAFLPSFRPSVRPSVRPKSPIVPLLQLRGTETWGSCCPLGLESVHPQRKLNLLVRWPDARFIVCVGSFLN